MGSAALKLDISKAYDRLEWQFLLQMMARLSFDSRWISLIMMCVSSVSYIIVQGGKEFGPILPGRGIRQGDPLSPCLFIICAGGLSSIIRNFESNKLIHGCKIAHDAPEVSYLFFADDSFLLFRANVEESSRVKNLLCLYEKSSGQSINLQKSSISFSSNVHEDVKGVLANLLQITETVDHGNYLGLPSLIGRKKS